MAVFHGFGMSFFLHRNSQLNVESPVHKSLDLNEE